MTLLLSGIGIGFALAVVLFRATEKAGLRYQHSAYEQLMGSQSNA